MVHALQRTDQRSYDIKCQSMLRDSGAALPTVEGERKDVLLFVGQYPQLWAEVGMPLIWHKLNSLMVSLVGHHRLIDCYILMQLIMPPEQLIELVDGMSDLEEGVSIRELRGGSRALLLVWKYLSSK